MEKVVARAYPVAMSVQICATARMDAIHMSARQQNSNATSTRSTDLLPGVWDTKTICFVRLHQLAPAVATTFWAQLTIILVIPSRSSMSAALLPAVNAVAHSAALALVAMPAAPTPSTTPSTPSTTPTSPARAMMHHVCSDLPLLLTKY